MKRGRSIDRYFTNKVQLVQLGDRYTNPETGEFEREKILLWSGNGLVRPTTRQPTSETTGGQELQLRTYDVFLPDTAPMPPRSDDGDVALLVGTAGVEMVIVDARLDEQAAFRKITARTA